MVGGGEGGFIGAVHRMAARLDDAWTLVAVAPSSDAARAAASGAAMHVEAQRVYTDWRDMARAEAARPDRIDAVSIVVPNHLHAPVATAFLEAGIAVLCDKPLATSRADGERLQALAHARGLPFAVTHNYSGYPMVRAARALVAQGRLGTLRAVHVEYAQDWLATPLEREGHRGAAWRTDPERAGPAGCLGDIGTHAAHLAAFVTGRHPQRVSADVASLVPDRRLDDHVQVLMRYEGGARGLLWASQIATGERNALRLRVYGTGGALRWEQERPDELWLGDAGGAQQRLARGAAGLPPEAADATRLPAGHPEAFIEAFANLYRDFAAAVRAGGPSTGAVPDVADGVRSLAFVEAVLASASNDGAWTDVT